MRTRLRSRVSLLFMTFALMLALPAMALADLVTVSDADTLQASGDTTKQAGQNGSARFHLLPENKQEDDPVGGCNATTSDKVKVAVNSTAKGKDGNVLATSPVTFASPGSVDLEGCDDPKTTTIDNAKSLGYTVSNSAQVGDVISVTASASGGRSPGGKTGVYSTDTFTITIVAPPEQGTALNVSPARGTYGGNTSVSATLSAGGTGVANKSVNFTFNGRNVSASTNSSGVATLTGVSLSGLDAGTHADAVSASYTGTGSGCTTNCYGASDGKAALTVDAKQITGSFTAADKVYDGGTSATVASKSLPGVLTGDTVSLDVTNAQFGTKGVGTAKTVSANLALSGADAGNYSLSSATGTDTANITAKSITGSFTAANKVYDGTNSATVATRTLNGAVNGDTVSLTGGTATFADENVGPNKTVALAGATLAGADAGNYSLASVGTTTAAITAKELTGSFTAENKVYDGNTDATIATSNLVGVVQGDDVGLSGDEASFADKNVANGKTVRVNSGSLTGTDAGNYALKAGPWTATANITPKSITGSFTATNKTYDGGTSATVKPDALPGVLANDTVSLDVTNAQFDNKNVGTAKTVSADLALSGAQAGNYSLSSATGTATANITQRGLVVTATAANKTYDDDRNASVTLSDNRVAGDVLTTSYTSALFTNANAGTGKVVDVSGIAISGLDARNYTVNPSTTASASILQRAITVTAVSDSKIYDGNTASDETPTITGTLAGDDMANFSQAFDNKNAGTGKALIPSGSVTDGNSGNNYKVTFANDNTGEITPKSLTGSFTADNKTYDGNTSATVATKSLPGVLTGDTVSLDVTNAQFGTKGVGTAKTVSANLALSGAQAGNYSLSSATATTTANITAKQVTASFTAADKVYDGNTNATITGSSITGGVVVGETVGISHAAATASFDNASVGTGKTVTGTGFTLTGVDAGNYSLPANLTTTASITPWTTKGFYQPVDMNGVYNAVKGGATVPLKFELFSGTTELTDTTAIKSLQATKVLCDNGATIDDIETLASGSTSLRYDSTSGQYIYNWKTPTGAGTCYKVTVTAQDGSPITAFFKMK